MEAKAMKKKKEAMMTGSNGYNLHSSACIPFADIVWWVVNPLIIP